MLTARSNREQFTLPHVVYTSKQISNFFTHHFKSNIADLAGQLEGFMLAGIESKCSSWCFDCWENYTNSPRLGPVQGYTEELLTLCKAIKDMIKQNLGELVCAGWLLSAYLCDGY
jgi:hypothetical protein